MTNSEKTDWIYSFFGGERDFYGKSYKAMGHLDSERTKKEIDGILDLLKPEPGSHILDWCGGWGRHAIPLAKEGFEVTLLDFCKEYLEGARQEAKQKKVKLDFVHADFRETPSEIQADYAINIFTAGLGCLGEENDIIALKSLFTALKPSAKFLIDTMSPFYVARKFQKYSWGESSDRTKRLLERRRFDFWNSTVDVECIYQDKEAQIEEWASETSVKLYSPADLARVLRMAGFEPIELYGSFNGSKFDFESKRIIMISQKP